MNRPGPITEIGEKIGRTFCELVSQRASVDIVPPDYTQPVWSSLFDAIGMAIMESKNE